MIDKDLQLKTQHKELGSQGITTFQYQERKRDQIKISYNKILSFNKMSLVKEIYLKNINNFITTIQLLELSHLHQAISEAI